MTSAADFLDARRRRAYKTGCSAVPLLLKPSLSPSASCKGETPILAHHSRTPFGRGNLVAACVAVLSLLVLGFGFAAHTARSPQDGWGQSEVKERKFENAIPGHVPLKVKLKSEKSFKDLANGVG